MDDTNLLLKAALVWSELTGYKYQIVYGYKGKLRYIPLSFYSEDFSHLAGFQYLKDLALPKYNPKKILEKVLDTTITFEQVRKGMKYEVAVEPRLRALSKIKNALDSNCTLYTFMARMLPFDTTIDADYLLTYDEDPSNFLFVIKTRINTNEEYLCDSVLSKEHGTIEPIKVREAFFRYPERVFLIIIQMFYTTKLHLKIKHNCTQEIL